MKKVALIIFSLPVALALAHICGVMWFGLDSPVEIVKEDNVAVPMRDGVVLRADIWRPAGAGTFPVLVYRTPYDKRRAPESYATYRKAAERGYAVVMQDVRGRYASAGEFLPYQQDGKDGYDTIEWAAKQPWSSGAVGTFGLSYPGAVQWLAAMERPPHLKAMVPAMTFSTPRNFFYSGGVFDGSWAGWIWNNIAPDVRVKKNLPGPKTGEEARAAWEKDRSKLQGRLPLAALGELREIAPWYFDWMRHEPTDAWWEWCELRGKYDRTDAAVLNLSGWYDEAYGPEGATTNYSGVVAARKGQTDKRAHLLIGPWVHGVGATKETKAGVRDFGPGSAIDYDEIVLRWMDRYVKGIANGVDKEKSVRVFVMGSNTWREADAWPIPGTQQMPLYLAAGAGKAGDLRQSAPTKDVAPSSFISDPAKPVTDPYPAYSGGHDYSEMAKRSDVLVFETAPLEQDTEVVGNITAEIYISCDAPDTDLWVKLLDVSPDGQAVNLMSPGLDVLRASYRNPGGKRELLEPGRVYKLELKNLITGNLFRKGHRIRAQISAAFFPHFSRNLHTGKLEMESAEMHKATIRIHHDRKNASRIVLPVIGR
ncbi:MAG: CocE/NonD family hydrolase [Acidobacteria bacterium]|nr:CocE/NonD family hydrolase [Acidobacteriota bacterium]MBI3661546.1 CocE/NonD family hydrolase [Acidobacteriota bacterium]